MIGYKEAGDLFISHYFRVNAVAGKSHRSVGARSPALSASGLTLAVQHETNRYTNINRQHRLGRF